MPGRRALLVFADSHMRPILHARFRSFLAMLEHAEHPNARFSQRHGCPPWRCSLKGRDRRPPSASDCAGRAGAPSHARCRRLARWHRSQALSARALLPRFYRPLGASLLRLGGDRPRAAQRAPALQRRLRSARIGAAPAPQGQRSSQSSQRRGASSGRCPVVRQSVQR